MMNSESTKKALMTMGLPGAGKSYVLANNYNLDGFTVIDPDAIKKEKADYSDKNPSVYHEWSKQEAKFRIGKAIHNNENLVIDGTGTNVEKMALQITELQKAGYQVEILYVKVKLETSIRRNAERARNVPEQIIHDKFETIEIAYRILKGIADTATIINND